MSLDRRLERLCALPVLRLSNRAGGLYSLHRSFFSRRRGDNGHYFVGLVGLADAEALETVRKSRIVADALRLVF